MSLTVGKPREGAFDHFYVVMLHDFGDDVQRMLVLDVGVHAIDHGALRDDLSVVSTTYGTYTAAFMTVIHDALDPSDVSADPVVKVT